MTTYLIPVIILCGCGILAGVLLTLAAKAFYVKVDERIKRIDETLPQANCGACGYAGCADYANAIIKENAPTNLCRPGGADTAVKIAEILGVTAGETVKLTAVVHCSGDCEATSRAFEYGGVQACKAAKRFYGGNGVCKYGCMGFGDCVNVCEYGAIKVINGIARVNPDKCTACGKCVKECPNSLITLKPASIRRAVLCSSKDNGKVTKQKCKNGCIACKMCEKKCPHGAITVQDFHAVIDYDKCTDCGICSSVCPVRVIHPRTEK